MMSRLNLHFKSDIERLMVVLVVKYNPTRVILKQLGVALTYSVPKFFRLRHFPFTPRGRIDGQL